MHNIVNTYHQNFLNIPHNNTVTGQTAYKTYNTIMVDNFASLFHCMIVNNGSYLNLFQKVGAWVTSLIFFIDRFVTTQNVETSIFCFNAHAKCRNFYILH